MQDAAFDPSTQAVLNTSSCPPGASHLMQVADGEQGVRGGAPRWESVSITEYRAERVVIEAHSDEPGILLLTDAAYPGWQATVDGEPVSICRADLLFRTVPLEPGEHRVVFAFRPLGQRVGGAVSGIGLVVLVIFSSFVFPRAR
jgi:uncharacterized membrane protein YfhO